MSGRAIPVALAALLLTGCAASPPERFYTLDAPAAAAAATARAGAPSVVVGPVTLPERVDRPQFVVRSAPHRVELLEQHRWAEPLRAGIPRVVAAELARLLGSERVAVHGENSLAYADFRVVIDVQRFEGAPGESVAVEARWSLRPAQGAPRAGHSAITEATRGPGYEELAAAYGRAVATLAREIAAVLDGAH